jgi:hypothetical protein
MPDPRAQLSRVRPARVFLVTLVLALLGLFIPGVPGAVLLYAIVVTLVWLLRRSPAMTATGPAVMRVLILVVIVAIATAKVVS